jgi:hypothetical protein
MEEKVFVEHLAILTDVDSGGDVSLPYTVLLREDFTEEDIPSLVEAKGLREHEWMFGGNTVEVEYIGVTGRVVAAVRDAVGKRWVVDREVRPREINIEDYGQI